MHVARGGLGSVPGLRRRAGRRCPLSRDCTSKSCVHGRGERAPCLLPAWLHDDALLFNGANAMEQYNVGQVNALEQFKQEINNQRDQFNAQNALFIAQANAQWRQQLATVNNAALNEANRQNALQANNLTQKGLDEIWQKERDLMAYAFATAESAAERRNQLIMQDLKAEAEGSSAFSGALGTLGAALINGMFSQFGPFA